ncbi:MAG TPA: tRNA adenosine(34) deaminase TadA [Pirellulales bacterium]
MPPDDLNSHEVVGPPEAGSGNAAPPGSEPLADSLHERFMRRALEEARLAFAADEVPVGAVIVRDGRIVAVGRNEREESQEPTAHAEIVVIRRAAAEVGSWRLEGCTLYVTLEPCPMCAGAILQARIPVVIYGADDPKAGAVRSLFQLLEDERLNHRCAVVRGVLAEPCGAILTEFFRAKRALGKK